MMHLKKIMAYWQNTKQMPVLLRMFCLGAMAAAPLLLLVLVLPLAPLKVNGQPVTYAELWYSGIGEITALLICLVGIGAWGMAARRGNSRWYVVLAALVPAVLTTLIPSFQKYSSGVSKAGLLAEAIVTAILLYSCLFLVPSVRRYFNYENSTK